MKSLFQMSKRALAVCVAVLMLIGLLPVGGLLASAATVEHMVNGGVESGNFSTGSWASAEIDAAITTEQTHSGNYAVKMDFDNGNKMLKSNVYGLSDAATYTFSFWYYVPAGETVQIQLMIWDHTWQALPDIPQYSLPVTTGSLAAHDTWLQYTLDFTLNSGANALQFMIYTAQAGDVYYIDDVSVSETVADPEPEPEPTVLNIDFDVETDKVNSVNYNSANIRTYLEVQTAQTLPIDGWAGYSGNATLLIDGVEVAAKAAGLGSANKFQIYTADGTGDFTGASEITIPAGTTFTKDNATVRFPKDFTIVKEGGAWQKKSAEPEIAYTDIDFDVETDTISSVGYNDGAQRTYLVIQSAQTLPVADWGTYAGNTTVLVDGVSVQAKAAGMANANQFQLYFVGDTTNYTTAASEITIPAGTTFTKDNAAIRFTKDFTIVKDGVWKKKAPEAVIPDHTTTVGANLPDGKTNLVNFGSFDAASGFSISGNGAVADGKLRMELSGSDDMASFQVPVTAGKTYRMSVYMWVMDSSNIRIDGEASGHKTAYQNMIYSDANAIAGTSLKADTEGWVEMIYEFTADNTATANIYFVRNYWGGNATVYLDDLCIYDINEQPPVVLTPSDHGGDTELPENAVSAGVQNGDFNATTGQNFVGNSSIENGMAKIEVSGTDDYIQFNGATVKAGVEYTLAFYVWITEASADMDFDLYMTGAGAPSAWLDFTLGNAAVTSNPTDGIKAATDGWQRVTVTWTAPADGEAIFGLKNYGGSATGVVYIDDVSVTYEKVVETPSDHGGDTELPENAVSAGVQNGDFNATTGQNFVGNSSIENGMAKIEVSGTDDYIQFNGATVKAGVEYTLAFYVWITEASADMDFDVYMTGAGAPSAWLDYTLGNAKVTSNPTDGFKAATEGWQRVTVTWTAPADGEAIFGLKNYSVSATGVVYIDDVSVTYEDTVEYIEIYANMVDLFAAQAQENQNRTVFGIEIDGVNIPYDASWRNFGYRNVLIDGVSANIPFGTTTSTNTWGMDANENKMLLYLPLAAYEATTVTIPAGTKLTHPVDTTLAYEFVEDIVITKSADCGWPEMLLRGAEVALGDACRSDIVIHVPSHYAEAGLQLQYTVNGVTDTAALTAVGNGLHTASIATSLKNIGDVYALQVVDADGKAVGLPVETYSVEEYAVMIAGSEDYTEEAQNAAMMLLNAGLKAQRYFGYNLDDEIAEWVTFPQETIEAIDEHILTNLPDMVIPDGVDNYVGSSLVLKDVTKIRMYFTTQVTGSVLAGNGFYYLEIGNIDALNLDTMYDVVVDGSTYKISVNSLVKQVIASESTSEAFKELARAMFLYNEAAEMM